MNQFEKAAMYFERAERRIPDQVVLGPILASTYGHLGQTQKGETLLEEQKKRQLKAWPGFPYTVREATYWYNFKNSEDKERLVAGLRKAGLG